MFVFVFFLDEMSLSCLESKNRLSKPHILNFCLKGKHLIYETEPQLLKILFEKLVYNLYITMQIKNYL